MIEQLNIKYREYIQNKSVVFVGACPNLLGRELGKKIDSYDIIVRSNNFWRPFMKDIENDYGSRCDVLYVNNQYHRETKPFPIEEMRIRGLKWLCFKGLNNDKINRYNKAINSRSYMPSVKYIAKALPSATAGLFLCADILNQKPKEFYYTGVDFFASKKPVFQVNNYREYLPGYLPKNIVGTGNRINAGKKQDGHNFIANAKYFYDMFKKNDNFKTDDFILDLLYGIVNGKIKQGDITWD